jgi:hypothetical protein
VSAYIYDLYSHYQYLIVAFSASNAFKETFTVGIMKENLKNLVNFSPSLVT